MLLGEAQRRGIESIATGHYANIETAVGGGRVLKKALDEKKDQSYFLYVLSRECLGALALPLGGYRKSGVRAMAEELGLPAARRAESQDICFVGRGGYERFIRELNGDMNSAGQIGPAAGPIVDTRGRRLGAHQGLHAYTIGQRRGTGVAAGEPLYVTAIDANANTLVVGRRDEVFSAGFEVRGVNWMIPPDEVFAGNAEAKADVKFRSAMKEQPSALRFLADGAVAVEFYEPQWAAASGQSAVFYRGGMVLGGGVIA
jgi:tRNA-specific 2-thiouridylase